MCKGLDDRQLNRLILVRLYTTCTDSEDPLLCLKSKTPNLLMPTGPTSTSEIV